VKVTPPPKPPSACADAGTQVIYVITQLRNLVAYDPPSNTFRLVGAIQCPGTSDTPFSMAVDRSGNAYTVYGSGEFFELHPSANGVACTRVAFSVGDSGISPTFGMGFAADAVGGGETLYIAGAAPPFVLARVPIPGFTAQPIGVLSGLVSPELTGTGGGDLFAFSGADCVGGGVCATSAIAQLDKTTGNVVGLDVLENLDRGRGWAFGFWGGDFYLFTSPTTTNGSLVTRFDPTTLSQQQVNTYPESIVGAGVSTCAPLGTP
jgi:hypothetical protein